MTHIESKTVKGVAEAVVSRYGERGLTAINHSRSGAPYAYLYSRGPTHDGSNTAGPFAASRHMSDYAKRPDWLAIELLEEHSSPSGQKWRTVEKLPSVVMVAGAPVNT